jgi:hypothetical protein
LSELDDSVEEGKQEKQKKTDLNHSGLWRLEMMITESKLENVEFDLIDFIDLYW